MALDVCDIALLSKLCAALHGRSVIGSMCDCKTCRCLDLSVLVGLSEGTTVSNHGQHYIQKNAVILIKEVPFSSHLADYIL